MPSTDEKSARSGAEERRQRKPYAAPSVTEDAPFEMLSLACSQKTPNTLTCAGFAS